MYKILFIDEENEQLDYFKDHIESFNLNKKVESLTTLPKETVDDMIETILGYSPDAIVTDFKLNEMKTDISFTVPYDGVDLVNEFLSIRNFFPCFILTAFDDEAVKVSEDVNIVYIKNILHNNKDEKAKASFLDRVLSQVDNYRFRIKEAHEELNFLLSLRKEGNIGIKQESRIIELDNLLERSIDARNSIPPELKRITNAEKLNDLINNVEDLLKKIQDKHDV